MKKARLSGPFSLGITISIKKASLIRKRARLFMSNQLLDLGFFIGNVLARLGIELHDLHFFGSGALVFGGGVEMTETNKQNQLDFVAAGFSHDDSWRRRV